MATNVFGGKESKIQMATTSGGTYTDIGQVYGGPSGGGMSWDKTTQAFHPSTENTATSASLPSTGTPSDISFSILYDGSNANHTALYDAATAGTTLFFKWIFSDDAETTLTFEASVGCSLNTPEDGFISGDITLTPVTAPVRTTGT